MKLKIDTSKLSEATRIELLSQQPLETLNGLARLLDVKRGRSKVALVKGLVISNKLNFAVDMGLGIKSADDQKFIGGGVTSAEFKSARDNILKVTKVETIPASEIAKIKAMVERKEPLPLSKPLPKKVVKKRQTAEEMIAVIPRFNDPIAGASRIRGNMAAMGIRPIVIARSNQTTRMS